MFAAPVYRRNYRQRGTHVVSAEQEMGWGHVFLSRILLDFAWHCYVEIEIQVQI